MSDVPGGPLHYQVSYSEHVRTKLRELIARAEARGLRDPVVAAVTEIDRRLHLYPQFGQPLRDLKLKPAQLWIGFVAPLIVYYFLHEERRLVAVLNPFKPLPGSGLDP